MREAVGCAQAPSQLPDDGIQVQGRRGSEALGLGVDCLSHRRQRTEQYRCSEVHRATRFLRRLKCITYNRRLYIFIILSVLLCWTPGSRHRQSTKFFAKTFLPRNENISQRLESKPDVHSTSSPQSRPRLQKAEQEEALVSHDILKLNVIATFCAKDNWHKWQSHQRREKKIFGKNPVTQFLLFSSRCAFKPQAGRWWVRNQRPINSIISNVESDNRHDVKVKRSQVTRSVFEVSLVLLGCVIRWSNICGRKVLWTQLRIW